MSHVENQNGLVRKNERQELVSSFRLIDRLFDEGEKLYGLHGGYSAPNYYDQDAEDFSMHLLRPDFAPLVIDTPEDNYFAYYSLEGGTTACISTQPNVYLTDDAITEHIYVKNGNDYTLKRSKRINNNVFGNWDSHSSDALASHGNIAYEYTLRSSTDRQLVAISASRVDEVVIEENGQEMPRRWYRDLRINPTEEKTKYSDHYILNRSAQEYKDQRRADITFNIVNKNGQPATVVVIGIDTEVYQDGELKYEDIESNLRIYVKRGHENELAILQKDPTLQFLFEQKIDSKKVLSAVHQRIRLLQEDWDKPHSVFTEGQAYLYATRLALPNNNS